MPNMAPEYGLHLAASSGRRTDFKYHCDSDGRRSRGAAGRNLLQGTRAFWVNRPRAGVLPLPSKIEYIGRRSEPAWLDPSRPQDRVGPAEEHWKAALTRLMENQAEGRTQKRMTKLTNALES